MTSQSAPADGANVPARRGRLRAGSVLVLVLAFSTLAQGTGQAQSSASLATNNAWIVAELASTAAGQAGGVGAVGTVPYFGNAPLSSGTKDFNPPTLYDGKRTVPGDKGTGGTADRAARRAGVLGLLANGLALALPWVWPDGHNAGYADPPAAAPGAYLGTSFTVLGNTMRIERAGTAAGGEPLYTWYRSSRPSNLYLIRKKADGSSVAGAVRDDLGQTTDPLSFSGGNGATEPARFFIVNGNWSDNSVCTGNNCLASVTATAAPPTSTGPTGTTQITTTTTSRCSDGSSSSTSVTYTGGTPSTALPAISVPACPSGTTRTKVEQSSKTADGRTVASPLGDTAYEKPAVPAGYPECVGTTCLVTIERVGVGGDTTVCNGTDYCAGWKDQVRQKNRVPVVVRLPSGATQTESSPTYPDGSHVLCRYGPYVVPVDECATVATEPAAHPAAGTGTSADTGNCMGGIGWNPTTWVTTPVKCALSWAFKPSAAPLAQAQATASALGNAAPFSYVTGTVGWVGDLDAGTSCFDLDVSTQQGAQRVLSTCSPGPFESWLVSNRSLLSAAMYAAFFVPLAWWAWRQYAPGAQGMA